MQVSVGIFAHNEAETIGEVVDAFLAPQATTVHIVEVLIVCCACIDGTIRIAGERAKADTRVKIVERDRRTGKVAAINAFLEMATAEVVIISGGDVVPGPHLVEMLLEPMRRAADCAMTGARVVSAVRYPHAASKLHDVMWQLHHEVARRAPKLGETVAVRRSLLPRLLPSGVHCDEVLIESLVIGNGGRLTYVSEAQVRNLPPRSLAQLYGQRRRVACQHATARAVLHYRPATDRLRNILVALIAVGRRDQRAWVWLTALTALEAAARVHGRIDYVRGLRYSTWRPVDRLQAPAAHVDDANLIPTNGIRQ